MKSKIWRDRSAGTVEVSSNVVLHVPSVDHAKVGFELVHQRAACLAHILFLAVFACDAIHQISALASDIAFALICASSRRAGDCTAVVQQRTVPALSGVAQVDICAARSFPLRVLLLGYFC